MQPGGTSTRPGLFRRILGQFSTFQLNRVQHSSPRLPDLEDWTMPHRSVDLRHWEVAYNAAKNPLNPDRTRLLDVYDSLLVDSHLAAAVETRVLRVLRSRYRLVGADGKPRPDLLPLLQHRWFEDFLWYAMEADFRGHTLIELGELEAPGKLKWVERINPRNVLPRQGLVVRRPLDTTGYKFREAPLHTYLIEVGRPDDLGSLSQVGPMAVLKKYALGSWSDYVHKFGIPARWVKTNSTDLRRIKQLETIMQGMVSSSYGVFAADEEVQIMPTPGTDAHQVFDSFIARLNSEISKRLLGQDGTTDNKDASGTYGSLKVLQGVAEDRHQADKASMAYVINNDLFPRLVQLGYPLAGIRFEWDGLQDLSAGELVDAVAKLGMVFDIDPKHVEERTGIKILGARRMPGEIGDANPTGNGKQAGKKKGGEEDGGEEDDDEDGDGITAQWGTTAARCSICGGGGMITASAVPPVPVEAVESLLRSAYNGAEFDPAYFDAIAELYVAELNKTWNPARLSLMADAPEHVAHALMESNLFRFAKAKDMAALLDLNALAKEGGTYADFERRAQESGLIDEYNRIRLRAEFTNVAMSGLQAGRYYQMQQTADVLPYGEYVTIGDGRVRQSHADLNRKVWPLEHDAWKTIWPPNGWGCRCTVLPTEAGPGKAKADNQWEAAKFDLQRTGEWKRMERGGFKGNRAESGTIFDTGALRRTISKNTGLKRPFRHGVEDSYGRPDMDMATVLARPNLPGWQPRLGGEGEYANWYAGRLAEAADSRGRAVLRDHKGRPWALDMATLTKHTGGDYTKERRWEYLHLMPEVMNSPDEVWIKQGADKRVTWNFVRFYQGKPVVVRAEVPNVAERKGNTLEITSWYSIRTKEEEAGVRSGTLAKKMPAAD